MLTLPDPILGPASLYSPTDYLNRELVQCPLKAIQGALVHLPHPNPNFLILLAGSKPFKPPAELTFIVLLKYIPGFIV